MKQRSTTSKCQEDFLSINELKAYREKLAKIASSQGEKENYQEVLHAVLSQAPATDVGNSLRMYARYGASLHFVQDWGVWLVWNGKRWIKDETHSTMALCKEMTGYIVEEYRERCPKALTMEQKASLTQEKMEEYEKQEKAANAIYKWAHTSQSKVRLESAIELLKSEPGITILSSALDADDTLLNFPNGTLNLITGEFRQPKRGDLITKTMGAEYDPEKQAPYWNLFMHKVTLGRADLSRYIQAVAGMGLFGQLLDECLAIFHGIGGNGKTVWVEAVKEVMGDYAATATSDLFTAKQNEGISNDIARLVGVRFLSASETAEGKFLDEALVKSLTGGDMKTARFLRQEFFEFRPKFTPVLLTNYPPVIRGTDSGIWRRLKLIPWDFDFTKDPEREDKPAVMSKLRAEGAGIINWLIAGLRLRLQHKSLDALEPDIVKQATQRYREDSDILGQFILEKLYAEKAATISKEELYNAYVEHARAGGAQHPMTKRTLGTKLQLRGWIDHKGTAGKRYWLEWRLRDDMDPEEEEKPAPAPQPLPMAGSQVEVI